MSSLTTVTDDPVFAERYRAMSSRDDSCRRYRMKHHDLYNVEPFLLSIVQVFLRTKLFHFPVQKILIR